MWMNRLDNTEKAIVLLGNLAELIKTNQKETIMKPSPQKKKAATRKKSVAAKKKLAAPKKTARQPKVRKVLIATPAFDGRVDVWYVNALINTIRLGIANNILIQPVFMSYDALVQRARNDLVSLAVSEKYDDMIFIDSDMEWNPEWVISLLSRKEHVVGGTTRKKTDQEEVYPVKTTSTAINKKGLMKCEAIGTGFVKLSKRAFTALYNTSQEYTNEGKSARMVFDVSVVDGELWSEDTTMFSKLAVLKIPVWLDPTMTCNHIGTKKFEGNFLEYLNRLAVQQSMQEQ